MEEAFSDTLPPDRLETLEPPYLSDAGAIQNLVNVYRGTDEHVGCVSVLWSKKGSVRARHLHREDAHRLYVLSGAVDYFERPEGSKETPTPVRYVENQMFFTPAGVEHAMRFVEDTVMVSISRRPRDEVSHESDVVRVDFPLPEEVF